MTAIEAKALALVNEVCLEKGVIPYAKLPNIEASEALCRTIEQHEAFKQEVSDAAREYEKAGYCMGWEGFERFIIPKPDPLVEVLAEVDIGNGWDDETDYARQIHKALAARGLEIREKNDD